MAIKKVALITGITGQDGSYLAELLLTKGYEVHGIIKSESFSNIEKLSNIEQIQDNLILHEGSLTDYLTVNKIFSKIIPDECYHLSAISFVNYSFNDEFSIISIFKLIAKSIIFIALLFKLWLIAIY